MPKLWRWARLDRLGFERTGGGWSGGYPIEGMKKLVEINSLRASSLTHRDGRVSATYRVGKSIPSKLALMYYLSEHG